MQGKILFTYLLLCKQQVDGARLLNNAISPQRCVCLCDGLAGVRGHPCLLLQRKRRFLMPVDYTENAVSDSNGVLQLYHFEFEILLRCSYWGFFSDISDKKFDKFDDFTSLIRAV